MLNWLNFGWSRWDSAMVTRRNHNFVPFRIKASGRWMKRDEFFSKFWKLWVFWLCMWQWCFFSGDFWEAWRIHWCGEAGIPNYTREFTHSAPCEGASLQAFEWKFPIGNGGERHGGILAAKWGRKQHFCSEWWMMMNAEYVDDDSAQKLQCTN